MDATPAQQGQTYECDDWATINGSVMTDAEGLATGVSYIEELPVAALN